MAAGLLPDSFVQALVTLAGAITQNQGGKGQLQIAAGHGQPSSTPISDGSPATGTSRIQSQEAENTSSSSRR